MATVNDDKTISVTLPPKDWAWLAYHITSEGVEAARLLSASAGRMDTIQRLLLEQKVRATESIQHCLEITP